MLTCRWFMQGLVVSGILAGTCFAQRETPNFQKDTEQTHALWRISWETDRASKMAQIESFIKLFPKHESIGWVYDQYYAILVEDKDTTRAIAVSEKILALDPADVELAYHSLKMAEEKKDAALVRSWAHIAAAAATRAMASPKDTEAGKRRLELAPQVLTYVDYVAYAEILTCTDRVKKVELTEAYLKAHPASPHKLALQRMYLATWREIDPAKAFLIAEKLAEKDPSNEDALILVAEGYAQREREPEKVVAYAEKVLALMEQSPRPEGVPDAEWSKKKIALCSRANWLIGSLAMQQNRYVQADRSIRAALPYLRSDSRLTSTALFYLGWANYKIGNIPDALRFTQDCARTKGPFQEQAVKNLAVIRSENSAHP